jgi:hypothetical protein
MKFDDILSYSEEIYANLLELIKTPGPSFCCARTLNQRKKGVEKFPITQVIEKIIKKYEKVSNIKLIEDNGNIVLVGGLDSNDPQMDEIKDIPIILGAHIDEVTYLISNKIKGEYKILRPLCSAPTRRFYNKEAEILSTRNGKLESIGYGELEAEEKISVVGDEITMEGWEYLLKPKEESLKEDIIPGDVVIQNYLPLNEYAGIDTVIRAKALDDRVGTVAVIYSLIFLSKEMPIKAILAGDEEGYPRDVAWARLVLPTYQKYCKNDVITILCDGINGADITEYPADKTKYLSDAILLPYTAHGKGGGDYRLFSLIQAKVKPIIEKNGFKIRVSTDYASRSFDAKIMNEFPLITFIDWSNGKVGDNRYKCHYHEEVMFRQIINIIGSIIHTSKYLKESIPHILL